MYDVISIGAATLDVFLRSKSLEIAKQNGAREICVPYGAKLEVDEIHFETGGGGTNSAVTFARQGLKTASIVQTGDDFASQKVRQDLENEGVDTSLVVEEKGGYTDYSTILWAPDGERTILVYRGKTKLEGGDIDWDKIKTKWFYISSVEGNLGIISKIKNQKSKIKVAWNPGEKELEQRKKLMKLLPGIEVLNLNREEMERLFGGNEGGGGVEELLKKAQKLPCRYVVITDSRSGSYFWDGRVWLWAGIYQDAPKIEATGAGDGFGSGLITGLIKGLGVEDCLRLATANASSVVGRVGGKKGVLWEDEVEEWLRKRLEIRELT